MIVRTLLAVPLAATTAVAGLAVAPATGTAAPSAPARGDGDPYGQVWNILPPGQSGTIDSADLAIVTAGDPDNQVAVDGENAPPNFADQLETYDKLIKQRPDSIGTDDLDRFYKDAGFRPQTVIREETPRPGTTIKWDQDGVPFIRGTTYPNTLFGSGYAGTVDRMFLMDILRHAGAARLAEFAGGSEANLEMDQSQLRSAFYTRREARQQIVKAARQFGTEGQRFLRGADAYLEGINAAQEARCPGGVVTGPNCPVEYSALQKQPEPWTRADLTYVASLVGGIFGKGGGGEVANAELLQRLMQRFGDGRGLDMYEDLRERNDPEAPTTASRRFPYGAGRVDPTAPGVALPDLGGPTAPGTGHEISSDEPGRGTATKRPDVVDGPFGPIPLHLDQQGMSNALLVGSEHTNTGHPITVFGPQTGYFVPQLLTEEVLVGPHVKARGVAFAGVSLVVQLGRGVDYAWSATSASNDNVDTVVERLCNTDGSDPTIRSHAYRRGQRCVEIDRRVHSETVVPNPAEPTPPEEHRFRVLRTHHGIVLQRTTVDDRPVAIVTQRSTYGREVHSVAGFARLNDPEFTDDAQSFERAVDAIDYTFNWFYSDNRDIAYFSSGLLPERAPGTSFDLPRWGARTYDWRGWLPHDDHPQQVNPSSGFLTSWNNKTAPGFAAADDVYGYGSVYRSLALDDRITAAIRGPGDLGAGAVTGLVADATVVDSRARYTLPGLLRLAGNPSDQDAADAVAAMRDWVQSGARRVDRDRDGAYAHEQAIAVFDTWWQDRRQSVAYDVLGDRLGDRLVRKVPASLDNHPRSGTGSAWNGVAWYGYLDKDLRAVRGRPVDGAYSTGYCGRGELAACRQTVRESLAAAVDRVLTDQGVGSVAELTYNKGIDRIRSTRGGVVGVRPIDWQNRPTFQQVVSFTGHRPRS